MWWKSTIKKFVLYIFPSKMKISVSLLLLLLLSLQSCLTLCDPIDGSPPDSPIPGILQARTLEWVAISFSNAWKWKVKVKSLSRVRLFTTPWTAAQQAPPSMGYSRQEYWSGVPLPSPNYCHTHYLNLITFKFTSTNTLLFPILFLGWWQGINYNIKPVKNVLCLFCDYNFLNSS